MLNAERLVDGSGEPSQRSVNPKETNTMIADFLGLCPFLGLMEKKETAWNRGLVTMFVMLVSSTRVYEINYLLLKFDLAFLRPIC